VARSVRTRWHNRLTERPRSLPDVLGRLLPVTDSDNDTVTFGYETIDGDAKKMLNLVTQMSYPDGTSEQVIYNRLDSQWMRGGLGRWPESSNRNPAECSTHRETQFRMPPGH
jgi:hypothetical protein